MARGQSKTIHSDYLLYVLGVIGKVKSKQGRSALVMKHTGKTTETPSKRQITFVFGVPIEYSKTTCLQRVHKIAENDIGELVSVRETLCATLPPEQKVAAVYRESETILKTLSKF